MRCRPTGKCLERRAVAHARVRGGRAATCCWASATWPELWQPWPSPWPLFRLWPPAPRHAWHVLLALQHGRLLALRRLRLPGGSEGGSVTRCRQHATREDRGGWKTGTARTAPKTRACNTRRATVGGASQGPFGAPSPGGYCATARTTLDFAIRAATALALSGLRLLLFRPRGRGFLRVAPARRHLAVALLPRCSKRRAGAPEGQEQMQGGEPPIATRCQPGGRLKGGSLRRKPPLLTVGIAGRELSSAKMTPGALTGLCRGRGFVVVESEHPPRHLSARRKVLHGSRCTLKLWNEQQSLRRAGMHHPPIHYCLLVAGRRFLDWLPPGITSQGASEKRIWLVYLG